jgi:large subunit ribosomal protein L11
MAKKIVKKIKAQVPAGKATPAGTLGPALGQAGVNIGEFINRFNDKTKAMGDDIIPVVISVYEDRSFDFILKTPPASTLILKAIGKEKGSGHAPATKIGVIPKAKVKEIAERKLPDLNTDDVDQAIKIIEGTARSMGVDVK